MTSELLTIVIPTRDRVDFLEKCLRSIFEYQASIPYVIVSDNSASDQPPINVLRSKYEFTYVRQSGRLTMTEHFNACLKLPTTRWVWMIHDDDELCAYSVERVESFLAECEDAGVVVAGMQCIDEEGKELEEWIPKTNGGLKGEEGLLRLGLDWGGSSPNMIFSVEASRQIGGFIEIGGAAADYTFALQLAYSYGVVFFPGLVGYSRQGPHQRTDFSTPMKAEAWLDFSIRQAEFIRTVGCSMSAADRIVDRTAWLAFLDIVPCLLKTDRSWLLRAHQRCLRASARPNEWQNRVRTKYPFLFRWPQWVELPLSKAGRAVLPASVRRWLRRKQSRLTFWAAQRLGLFW